MFFHRQYAAVAQLDRVFGYEPKGRGFESLQPYQSKRTAMWQSFYSLFILFICNKYLRGMDQTGAY